MIKYIILVLILVFTSGCKNISVYPFTMPKDEPKFPDDYGIKVVYTTEF